MCNDFAPRAARVLSSVGLVCIALHTPVSMLSASKLSQSASPASLQRLSPEGGAVAPLPAAAPLPTAPPLPAAATAPTLPAAAPALLPAPAPPAAAEPAT